MAAKAGAIRAGRAFVELFADDSRLARGLRSAERKLAGFAASTSRMGRSLVQAGTIAAAPLALAGTIFGNFEQTMARVKALSGATGDDFARLEKKAKELGATTVFSASQAADAMAFFALAGFDVDRILTAIGPTLNLAAAGQLEIAQAADIVAKIMAGMGIEAENVGHAVDVLTKAMTTANTDLVELGNAMKFVGPIAKTAGISLEETVAAVQLLSDAGMGGEMAGTILRGALLSLTAPSAEAEQALKKLGIRVLDEQGNVWDLASIIGDFQRALSGMGSGERLKVIGDVFAARQAGGFAELISAGEDALRTKTSALAGAGGTSARIAGVQLDTLKGDFTILLSTLEGLAINVGEAIGRIARPAIQWLSKVVAAFGTWVGENQTVVILLGSVIAAVMGTGIALLGLAAAAKIISFALGGLSLITTGLAAAFKLVAAGFGLLLTPLGAVVGAVALLGVWFLSTQTTVGDVLRFLGEKFSGLRDTAVQAFEGIRDAIAAGDLQLAARILWLALRSEWLRGVSFLKTKWIEFKEFFTSVWTNAVFNTAEIATNAFAMLESAWIQTRDALADAWSFFTSFFRKSWNSAIGFARKAFARFRGLFDEDFDVDAEIARINADVAGKNEGIDTESSQAILDRERQRKAQLAGVESQRTGTLDELQRERDRQLAEAQSGFASELEETERALAKAREDFQKALDEASQKRAEVEATKPTAEAAKPGSIQSLVDQLWSGVGAAVDARQSIAGTFSAFGARGLGAGRPEERTAKATEETAKNTKKLVSAAKQGGLVFE